MKIIHGDEIKRKPVKTLRNYQQDRIKYLESIFKKFKDDPRAFLSMPVGTGKTFTALSFAIKRLSGKKAKSCIWVVHQTLLVDQSAKSFVDDFESLGGLLSQDRSTGRIDNITFTFMTWQGLRELINRKEAKAHDLLIIDEAHYGSSGSEAFEDHTSFKKIMKSGLFKEQIYVTATPWDLNPSVFPKILTKTDKGYMVNKDRIALLTMTEARKYDVISDVIFNVFHSADILKLRNLEDESEETIEAEDTEGLVKELKKKNVNLQNDESKRVLRRAITESVIEGFMRIESENGTRAIPPTVVFCSSINGEDDPRSVTSVMKTIKAKAIKLFGTKFKANSNFVYCAHSKMEEDPTEVLERFKQGKINILCVVGMAQEGYDYPELEVAVDLSPSLENARRRMQRIGRVIRKKDKPARYYYADTVSNYVMSKGERQVLNSETRDKLEDDIRRCDSTAPETTVDTVANTTLGIANINQFDNHEENIPVEVHYLGTQDLEVGSRLEVGKDESFNLLDVEKKAIISCTSVGYIISDATLKNQKMASTIRCGKLFDMLERESDGIPWETLLADEVSIRKLVEFINAP